jgi:hypothetical protein
MAAAGVVDTATQVMPMNLHMAGAAGATHTVTTTMDGAGVMDGITVTGAMADGVMGMLGMAEDGITAVDGTVAAMNSQVAKVDSMVAGTSVAGMQLRMKATVADIIAADLNWASNLTSTIV